MKSKNNPLFGSLFLASCLNPVISNKPAEAEPGSLETKVEENISIGYATHRKNHCPQGMSNIDYQFCIDQYEASVIDQTSGKFASPHYIPSQDIVHDADWQFRVFKNMGTVPMPERGAEQFLGFKPIAVSLSDKIPVTYAKKDVAKEACDSAGKRLCTRTEWYKACVGPDGPLPYRNEKEEIFPKAYPYGLQYQSGKCNIGLHGKIWPPGLLGRADNWQMQDPRISPLLGENGLPMKQSTNSFKECTNEYEVYNTLGNVHEIVSDFRESKTGPKIRITLVGSHYARSARESCAEATLDHGNFYTNYSIGFRCCTDIKERNIQH